MYPLNEVNVCSVPLRGPPSVNWKFTIVLSEWISLQRLLITLTSWSAVAVITTLGIVARFTFLVCTRQPFRRGDNNNIHANLGLLNPCLCIKSFRNPGTVRSLTNAPEGRRVGKLPVIQPCFAGTLRSALLCSGFVSLARANCLHSWAAPA